MLLDLRPELARRLGIPPAGILRDEPLSRHTSMGVGGPADYYIAPQEAATICALPAVCRELGLPLTVLGYGTNLVIADSGLRGVVLQIDRNSAAVRLLEPDDPLRSLLRERERAGLLRLAPGGSYVLASSGTALGQLAHFAQRHSLSGLEAAHGIPGSVGGALFMNAGAYGFQMADVVVMSRALDTATGEVRVRFGEEHCFGYRHSCYAESGDIILDVVMCLPSGAPDEILARMRDFSERRRESQPLDLPSAGSVFKRPTGHFAGKLIADAGLQGTRVGDAEISTKHAGFIVNRGRASAEDVRALVMEVQRTVDRLFGVWLTPEIRFLGWAEENGGIPGDR
ncbi:MAG: UDP-N-acetylmuramate dehydrogenase [Bacillota bacterium]|nr:UDP-N-acetylmuramate dehydrogenase [Bacillota bacterium]